MTRFPSKKRALFLCGILFAAILFLPGPWGITLIGAAGTYVWKETDPARRAERELERARTYKPAAEELVRYCQTPSLRSMSASQCGELGPMWLPEGVLENVVVPLRASQSHSRAMIPWGTVEVNLDSARISLQGDMGYHLERDAIDANAETASWTLYRSRGPSRTQLYSFSMPLDTTLTREEAFARAYLGERCLLKHALPGPSEDFGGADLALYLGGSTEARAACRKALELQPNTPGIVLLNGLLLAEESSWADGESLILEWVSRSDRNDRKFFLACFYYYSGNPEKVAAVLRDMLAQGGEPFTCSPAILALTRYLFETSDFESVLEICQSQLRPAPGYNIAAECYNPYHELLAVATTSRNGPEVHELPAWPATWEPVDPFNICGSYRQHGSARDSILYVEHILRRPIEPLGPPPEVSASR